MKLFKALIKLTALVIFIAIIAACNSESNNNSNTDTEEIQIQKQLFVIEEGPVSKETISEIIDKSGIRKGGYVVIIPTSFDNNKSIANNLKNSFYAQEITAVHILDLQVNPPIKQSDLLAIENANIICILDGDRNKFMKLANSSNLKKSLSIAFENGCLMAGKGNGISILEDCTN